MNDNDILNSTRRLIEGLKEYTDRRIYREVERAVRRMAEERRTQRKERIRFWCKRVGVAILSVFCLVSIFVVGSHVMGPNASVFVIVCLAVLIFFSVTAVVCMLVEEGIMDLDEYN